VRRKLEALGEVNLGAIEEHEELAERFRFLSEQKTDLETTVASLRDAITRINRTSRKRFRETFDAVNERFQKNYPRLFRGGKASLFMAEDEDVLEAGVDIQAQPPGKRLQNVNLLSGGEKTLTAIALLISLFQVRPSPFFLLDEVDAALDDANVGRFNEIVREMAEESQFLSSPTTSAPSRSPTCSTGSRWRRRASASWSPSTCTRVSPGGGFARAQLRSLKHRKGSADEPE
jgi:chromosome segregation protein